MNLSSWLQHKWRFHCRRNFKLKFSMKKLVSVFVTSSTPYRPKGSPFELFWDNQFWLTDPKIFLKAPIYTNFKGGARAKKCPKTPFWPVFSKFCMRRRNFGQNRIFLVLRRALGKPIWSKKRSTFFFKIPPQENPRSAPDWNHRFLHYTPKKSFELFLFAKFHHWLL